MESCADLCLSVTLLDEQLLVTRDMSPTGTSLKFPSCSQSLRKRGFPWWSVVKTPRFQCRGRGFDPWWGFPSGSNGKESVCNAGDPCSIPGWGRSPGEGLTTHSSILAWRTPWTEGPGGLQSMGSQRVGHD